MAILDLKSSLGHYRHRRKVLTIYFCSVHKNTAVKSPVSPYNMHALKAMCMSLLCSHAQALGPQVRMGGRSKGLTDIEHQILRNKNTMMGGSRLACRQTTTFSGLVRTKSLVLASLRHSAVGDVDSSVGIDSRDSVESSRLRYKRVMLKVSGEALEGSHEYGIDPGVLQSIAKEVADAVRCGVEVAIVVGGGNFFRGVDRWDGMERATADYVGMLATVMNAMCLQSALEHEGVQTRVQTAIEMQEIAEPYIRRRAIRHLERGRVVIFGAGTGNPFFTTDTAAALRAAEIGADAFFKATKVDGVYDKDPVKNPEAVLHKSLSFREVLLKDLNVMDDTAITLCKENSIPVVVFNLHTAGNVVAALLGDPEVGTVIS